MIKQAEQLVAPFPYFGGKRTVVDEVWRRFGDTPNYVEPFAGSAAMLLARPHEMNGQTETINDANGYVANFWRAVRSMPQEVAHHADWPVNENDLHARHVWLVERKDDLRKRLEGDPEWCDAKIAGWWCWGLCCWIGSGWCDGNGPWGIDESEGFRQLVHLGNKGRGVNRQLVHLGNKGRGVNRQLVHLGDKGRGVNRQRVGLYGWMDDLADRLRRVRVCCGDWQRVCGDAVTVKQGTTAVFLDPPYLHATSDGQKRHGELYGEHDDSDIAHAVRGWAIERQGDKRYRIALCGYEGEHDMPGWDCWEWKAKGGYGSQGSQGSQNAKRERIWFSPHCLNPTKERGLFE